MDANTKPHKIELLAPARDAQCAREAILHGADAVYIGGPGFGARAAAGNAVDDIVALCDFAHVFGAKVYVTLNTILYDSELKEAEDMVWQLYRAGADALIVQDLALLEMDLPPIALHASTQMDNRTPEKAQWLEAAGFSQIVLARETSLEDTRRISQAVRVPLEAFVHGALCVSYSGRCYASEYCFSRSANRGRCAQFCRLAFDLIDSDGRVWQSDRHLLSLRDMNRTASLEEMMDAGVRSFKIEGRLKDSDYVKNVTAWYRAEIDKVIARRPESYARASYGKTQLKFVPNPARSFNRGFTDYFLRGTCEASPVHSFDTPKATGAYIGTAGRVTRRSLVLRPAKGCPSPIVAGDGLCFTDTEGKLKGFRVNKVEGGEIFPATMPRITPGAKLYRNLDHAFSQLLAKPTATRTLAADITLRETPQGYSIEMADESGTATAVHFPCPHENARTPQRETMARQLAKLGGTVFAPRHIAVETEGERFIPSSTLAEWRRELAEKHLRTHRLSYHSESAAPRDGKKLDEAAVQAADFTSNVSNALARRFYTRHGAASPAPAFELRQPDGDAALMTCRHCIRRALGCCLKTEDGKKLPRQLALRLGDGRMFPLRFDCKRCEMLVMRPEEAAKTRTAHH